MTIEEPNYDTPIVVSGDIEAGIDNFDINQTNSEELDFYTYSFIFIIISITITLSFLILILSLYTILNSYF